MNEKTSTLQSQFHKRKFFALLWLALSLVAFVYTALCVHDRNLSSNIFDLLPQQENSAELKQIHSSLQNSLSRTVIFAVKDNKDFTLSLDDFLKSSPVVESVSSSVTEQEKADFLSFFIKHRLAFLSASDKKFYLTASADRISQRILSELFSAFAAPSLKELTSDPFLLTRAAAKNNPSSKLTPQEGFLTSVDSQNVPWTVLNVRLKSSLSEIEISQWISSINGLIKEKQRVDSNLEVCFLGSIFHQEEAKNTAKTDVQNLSIVSVLLLSGLFLFVFRTLKPILLCLLSVGIGTIFGLAATFSFFESVHAITLVMCISLIGISTDYTTHYLLARQNASAKESPLSILKKLKKPLLQALITTVLAYGLMVISPFGSLRQLGVFAVFGLIGSFLTVSLWFPLFSIKPAANSKTSDVTNSFFLFCSSSKSIKAFVGIVFITILALGLPKLSIDDDLIRLYQSSQFLSDSENKIKELTGANFSQKGIVVTAPSEDALIQQIEKAALVINESKLPRHQFIYPALLSLESQLQVRHRLEKLFPEVAQKLQETGIELSQFPLPEALDAKGWLNSHLGQIWKPFLLNFKNEQAFYIPIETSKENLQTICSKLSSCFPITQREDIQTWLGTQRTVLSWFICFLVFGFMALFWYFFGWKKSIIQTGIIVLSGTAALATLGLTGMPFNLFSVFALILILGIGADYQIFSANRERVNRSTYLAISVSAVTTLISLGVLVLSKTEAIKNFGLIVCVGIATSYLIVLLSAQHRLNGKNNE